MFSEKYSTALCGSLRMLLVSADNTQPITAGSLSSCLHKRLGLCGVLLSSYDTSPLKFESQGGGVSAGLLLSDFPGKRNGTADFI